MGRQPPLSPPPLAVGLRLFEIRCSRVHSCLNMHKNKHRFKRDSWPLTPPPVQLLTFCCCCRTTGSLPTDLLLASSHCAVYIHLHLASTIPLFSHMRGHVFSTKCYTKKTQKHNLTKRGSSRTCEHAGRKARGTMRAIRCIGNEVLASCIPCWLRRMGVGLGSS